MEGREGPGNSNFQKKPHEIKPGMNNRKEDTMKKIIVLITACLLGFFVISASGAQDRKENSKTEENMIRQLREGKVQNFKGDDLGIIRNVVVDAISGKAVYVLIMYGNKIYPVPADLILFQSGTGKIILDVDKDKLLRAPSFTADSMPDLNDAAYGSRIYRYYGVSPFWEENLSPEREIPAEPKMAPAQPAGELPVPDSRQHPII